MRAASHDIDKEITCEYHKLSSRLIDIINDKEAELDKKELDLKDKFYDTNIRPELIKEFVVKHRERYGQQESILRFIGDTDIICDMIREFDNERLLNLYNVLQWLYWYNSNRTTVDNDKKSLEQIVCFINNEIANPKYDKIRLQNLVYLKVELESIINS